jgi:hypothetical protein
MDLELPRMSISSRDEIFMENNSARFAQRNLSPPRAPQERPTVHSFIIYYTLFVRREFKISVLLFRKSPVDDIHHVVARMTLRGDFG